MGRRMAEVCTGILSAYARAMRCPVLACHRTVRQACSWHTPREAGSDMRCVSGVVLTAHARRGWGVWPVLSAHPRLLACETCVGLVSGVWEQMSGMLEQLLQRGAGPESERIQVRDVRQRWHVISRDVEGGG
eukprot:2480489-Rhodomonas_salina.1